MEKIREGKRRERRREREVEKEKGGEGQARECEPQNSNFLQVDIPPKTDI